jgi:HK97 family phage portal protein
MGSSRKGKGKSHKKHTQDRALWQVGDAYPGPETSSGVRITPDTALRSAAVFSCVRLLADVVSELPVHVYSDVDQRQVDPPRALITPAAGTDLPDWIWQHMVSFLLRGNVMGVIADRVGPTRPAQIELVNPDRVTVQVTPDGTVWRLDGREIDRADLWHRRAYPMPGEPLGLSPIAYFANTVGLGLAVEGYGATFFRDATTPTGVLTSDQVLNIEQAEMLHAMWQAARGGRRDTAVLGFGTKFQPISIAPEESQFIETMRLNTQQIARIFGIPPEMIGADSGNSMTYSNIESRDLSLLKYSVGPWLGRLERAMNTLVPRGQYVKFNAAALLRTDTLSRYQSYAIGLDKGFLTNAEVRALEDRAPLPAAQAGSVTSLEAVA